MELIFGVLLMTGCTVGVTSPFGAPIAFIILLTLRAFRKRFRPYFLISITTATLMALFSIIASRQAYAMDKLLIQHIVAGFFIIILMGVAVGFVNRPSQNPELSQKKRWRQFLDLTLYTHLMGYIIFGIFSSFYLSEVTLISINFEVIFWVGVLFYIGGFFISGLAAFFTLLYLTDTPLKIDNLDEIHTRISGQ